MALLQSPQYLASRPSLEGEKPHSSESDESGDECGGGDGSETVLLFRLEAAEQKGGELLAVGACLTLIRTSTTLLQLPSLNARPPACLHAFITEVPIPVVDGSLREELSRQLTLAFHPVIAGLGMPRVLLHGPPSRGKRTVVRQLCDELGVHLCVRSAIRLVQSGGERKATAELSAMVAEAQRVAPCVLLVRRLDLLAAGDSGSAEAAAQAVGLGDAQEVASGAAWIEAIEQGLEKASPQGETAGADLASTSVPGKEGKDSLFHHQANGASSFIPAPRVVLVGSTRSLKDVPTALRRCFTMTTLVGVPPLPLRAVALHASIATQQSEECGTLEAPSQLDDGGMHAKVGELVRSHPALGSREWALVCSHARFRGVRRKQREMRQRGVGHVQGRRGLLSERDVVASVAKLAKLNATAAGSPSVPDVKWDDVGGQQARECCCPSMSPCYNHPTTHVCRMRKQLFWRWCSSLCNNRIYSRRVSSSGQASYCMGLRVQPMYLNHQEFSFIRVS